MFDRWPIVFSVALFKFKQHYSKLFKVLADSSLGVTYCLSQIDIPTPRVAFKCKQLLRQTKKIA